MSIFIRVVENARPEGVNRPADVVYMNARHVLMQEQLQRDRRASRIGFDVLAITRVPVGNRRRLSIPGNYSVPYQLKAT